MARVVESYNKQNFVNVVQFILLGLYGLCSGDKRSYEFSEAFQGNLIQVCSLR